jgi:hypothetical protein
MVENVVVATVDPDAPLILTVWITLLLSVCLAFVLVFQ